MTTADDPAAPTPHACYGLGWFVDTCHGRRRISHSGYLHDVNSDVSLFPEEGIGVVSWTNFGPPLLARLINQVTCELLCKTAPPPRSLDHWLDRYEAKVTAETQRRAGPVRARQSAPSHDLADYAGSYEHPGYGALQVRRCDSGLTLRFRCLELPLEHWQYDAWIAQSNDLCAVHAPHVFDPTNVLLFETGADGTIGDVSFTLEPAVAPIRFVKRELLHASASY